ncbi:MAG: cupin domain-containing protein [Bacteroidia bacterium]|nr:cupin domain-containing protein [Bacteroidia bacterium]
MKKQFVLLLTLVTSMLSFAGGIIWKENKPSPDIVSHIYKKTEVKKSSGSWGSIYMYTNDSTSTYGTKSMLTAVLEFLPGKQLQPPHQHENEEFQYIIEGSGTWFLNGKETPIQKGDLMYAKPWDMHGISNTGADMLKFFVMKWINKGVEKPAQNKE